MDSSEFDAEDWVRGLASALAGLADVQEHYRDEIDLTRKEGQSPKVFSPGIGPAQLSDALRMIYADVYLGGELFEERRYAPLRSGLREVRDRLVRHPVFARALPAREADSPCGRSEEFWLQLPDRHGHSWTTCIVGGLMARGLEGDDDGFEEACRELNWLLDPHKEGLRGDLDLGYHVAVFHGLRVDDEVRIGDDMTVRSYEGMDPFVNEGVLKSLSSDLLKPEGRTFLGAIVKPFRWTPVIRPLSDEPEFEPDEGGSFKQEAEAFIELLAVLRGAPVVNLVTLPNCLNRVTCSLLGESHVHGRCIWGRWVQALDGSTGVGGPDAKTLEQARNAFRARGKARYATYEPVIARLAEALARTGRFALEDKILDVAIALERMYELDKGEIEFKLKSRTACLLESDSERRLEVFRDIGQFYEARSAIVHKPGRRRKKIDKAEAFAKGYEAARRSLMRLLEHGPPPDWNQMVIGGAGRTKGENSSAGGRVQPGDYKSDDKASLGR